MMGFAATTTTTTSTATTTCCLVIVTAILAAVAVVVVSPTAFCSAFSISSSSRRKPPQSSSPRKDTNSNIDNNKEPDTSATASLLHGKRQRREILEDEMKSNNNALNVQPIGIVRSVYRLCVGTPRQGLLAPHAKGQIVLNNGLISSDDNNNNGDAGAAAAAVDGLDGYSHIWIVFVFHLNTVGKKKSSKISPPALGGTRKVGVLATRSPHRFNPIGITLARLDGISTTIINNNPTTTGGKRKNKTSTTVLHISGLDLVDGTPVLDIKPYVPTYDSVVPTTTTTTGTIMDPTANAVQVPGWVADGLATRRHVDIVPRAQQQLRQLVMQNALDFYRPNTKNNNGNSHDKNSENADTVDAAYDDMLQCIIEVLSMDVRSPFQTAKARQGRSKAERAQRMRPTENDGGVPRKSSNANENNMYCTQQLDNLLISFTVETNTETDREASAGSGAEDRVVVHSIELWKEKQRQENS